MTTKFRTISNVHGALLQKGSTQIRFPMKAQPIHYRGYDNVVKLSATRVFTIGSYGESLFCPLGQPDDYIHFYCRKPTKFLVANLSPENYVQGSAYQFGRYKIVRAGAQQFKSIGVKDVIAECMPTPIEQEKFYATFTGHQFQHDWYKRFWNLCYPRYPYNPDHYVWYAEIVKAP